MRTALKIFAGIVLAIATLASMLGFIALASDPPGAHAIDATILAAAIGLALFAAILWMLTDIAEALYDRTPGAEARPVHPRELIA